MQWLEGSKGTGVGGVIEFERGVRHHLPPRECAPECRAVVPDAELMALLVVLPVWNRVKCRADLTP